MTFSKLFIITNGEKIEMEEIHAENSFTLKTKYNHIIEIWVYIDMLPFYLRNKIRQGISAILSL